MQSEPNIDNTPSQIVPIAIGFLIGATVVGACWLSSGTARPAHHDVVRNVIVDYLYEYDPGSASGSGDLPVDSIEFSPGYIVVTDTNGTTQLLAINRLRKFHYRPSDK